MSEIVSFGQCIFNALGTDAAAIGEMQSNPGIRIDGVDPERASGSDCAVLLYELQSSTSEGERVHRGMVCALHLEQFSSGKILPLELPDESEIARQLHELEVSRTQKGAISALYTDPCCVLEALGEHEKQRPAEVEFSPQHDVRCRVWKVENQTLVQKVSAVLDKKALILVNGRSLYEAMLRYRDACREANGEYSGREAFNYACVALSNIDDFSAGYGMTIEPVISTCCLPLFRDIPLLLAKLGEFFNVSGEEIESEENAVSAYVHNALSATENPADLVLYPGGSHIYTLQLRTRQQLQQTEFDEKQLSADSSAILYQRLILNYILEVSSEDLHDNEVFYVPENIDAACQLAADAQDCVAFFAPGPSISQVRDIAWDNIQVPAGLIHCKPLFPSGLVDFSLRD
jgi:hypothetical protein